MTTNTLTVDAVEKGLIKKERSEAQLALQARRAARRQEAQRIVDAEKAAKAKAEKLRQADMVEAELRETGWAEFHVNGRIYSVSLGSTDPVRRGVAVEVCRRLAQTTSNSVYDRIQRSRALGAVQPAVDFTEAFVSSEAQGLRALNAKLLSIRRDM